MLRESAAAPGLALHGGRNLGDRRPAGRGRRAGPDLPRPGGAARRRRREHLLVRRQQGRAARPGQPTTCSADVLADVRAVHRRRRPDRRPARASPSRSSTPSSSGPGWAPTSCATPACSPTPCGSTSGSASRCCGSTSLRARASTPSRRSSGFVVGIAADLGQQPPAGGHRRHDLGRDEYLARYADQWRELDPDDVPVRAPHRRRIRRPRRHRAVPRGARPAARRPPPPGRPLTGIEEPDEQGGLTHLDIRGLRVDHLALRRNPRNIHSRRDPGASTSAYRRHRATRRGTRLRSDLNLPQFRGGMHYEE